jgi:cystathionine gamma-synthase
MERHSANALAVARFLAARDDVAQVRYPGLSDGPHAHAGHATAAAQMRLAGSGEPAFGGMVSFLPAAGGTHGRTAAERAIAVAESTRLFTLAESLGGVESLVEVPAAMTHLSVASSSLAVDPALVRLSVGIEAVEDLLADLGRALDGA